MKPLAPVFTGLCCGLSMAGVYAAEKIPPQSAPVLSGGLVMQTIFGLALIVVLIFVLGWVMKRFGRLPIGGNNLVSVLGGVSLGPREKAVLLEAEGVKLLVGVAPGRVSKLHVFETDATDQSIIENTTAFDETLKTEMKGEAQ